MPEVATTPDLMTREECCAYLRIRSTKLWMLDQEGTLKPSIRLGRRVLYRRADVVRFCERLARKQRSAK